jgi:transcriptional regulator with XRE-family HTH domain
MIHVMAVPSHRSLEALLGDQVRSERRARGLTQAEVARLANVSRSAIVNLEAGAGSSLATFVDVLDALGRSEWLATLHVPSDTFNPLDLLDQPPRTGRRRPRPRTGTKP